MALAPGLEQYDLARKRAKQQNTEEFDRQRDALNRRFAQLGNLNSGARMKIEQQATDESSRRLNDAIEGVNAQEQAELARRFEAQKQRDFQRDERLGAEKFYAGESNLQRKHQTSEREGAQQFQSGEAGKQRAFLTGEREGAQGFQSDEAGKQRAFITGEREGAERFQSGEAEKQREFITGERKETQRFQQGEAREARRQQLAMFEKEYGLKANQFEEAKSQFEKTFAEDIRISNFNMDLANRMMREGGGGGVFDGMFGGLSKGVDNLLGDSWLTGNKYTDFAANPFISIGNASTKVAKDAVGRLLNKWGY